MLNMTPSFRETFPNLSMIKPLIFLGNNYCWDSPFSIRNDDSVTALLDAILFYQIHSSTTSIEWCYEISDKAIEDINNILNHEMDEIEKRGYLFLKLIIGTKPLELSISCGQEAEAYHWIHKATSSDYDQNNRYNSVYSFVPLYQSGDIESLGTKSLFLLPRWLSYVFITAREYNLSPELANILANYFFDVLINLYRNSKKKYSPLVGDIAFAIAAIVAWAMSCDHENTEIWTQDALTIWNDPCFPDAFRPSLATIFITEAYVFTRKTSQEWAKYIIKNYGEHFREHEKLQFLIASIGSYSDWVLLKNEIIQEIKNVVGIYEYSGDIGANVPYSKEYRASLLRPLIHFLVKEKDLHSIIDVMSAWYKNPTSTQCDDNVLFICPGLDNGLSILWIGGCWGHIFDKNEGHHRVKEHLSKATGMWIDPENPLSYNKSKEWTPDHSKGNALEAEMTKYYLSRDLFRKLKIIEKPRSLLIFPSLSDPIQALLYRDTSLCLPIEISLSEPKNDRRINRISIWAGETFYTHFETEIIEDFGKKYGISVSIFLPKNGGTKEDFVEFYQQPDIDILWVIGHGEFVHDEPQRCGIVIMSDDKKNSQLLPMDDLALVEKNTLDRRLLILNICSGAATQGMSGLSRMGIGPSLVDSHQAVIAHLWPSTPSLSLAFGALFASNINKNSSFMNIFSRTLQEMRDCNNIITNIESRLGKDLRCKFRLENDMEDFKSILSWGSPVFMT